MNFDNRFFAEFKFTKEQIEKNFNNDLPPKKWTQRRVGGSITTGSKTGGVLWMGRGISLSGLTGI